MNSIRTFAKCHVTLMTNGWAKVASKISTLIIFHTIVYTKKYRFLLNEDIAQNSKQKRNEKRNKTFKKNVFLIQMDL